MPEMDYTQLIDMLNDIYDENEVTELIINVETASGNCFAICCAQAQPEEARTLH